MAVRALIAFLLLIWSPAAFAQSAPWRVTEAAGQVQVRRGAQVFAARRGASVAPGEIVSTGANGRAVLVRNRDFVIVSPRTQLRVPGAAEEGGHVRIIQASGRAQYRIERQAAPHFAVRTPHLVALVKGTVFTVTVGEEGATVAVTEGRVEVSTIAGEMRQMVEPGFAASVSASDPARLSHGRSDDAQAAGEQRREASADRRSDAGDGGNASEHGNNGNRADGHGHGHGNGHGQPRLEYGELGNAGAAGHGNGLERTHEIERSVADAVGHVTSGNGNGNGGGNGNGNSGGSGSGSVTDPVTDGAAPSIPPVPSIPSGSGSGSGGGGGDDDDLPAAPLPPAPSPGPGDSGSGSSGSGSGSSGSGSSNSGSGSSGSGSSNSGPGSSNSGPGSTSSGSGSSGSGSSGSGSSGSGSSGSGGVTPAPAPPPADQSVPLDPTISLPAGPVTAEVTLPPAETGTIVPSAPLDPTISLPTAPTTTAELSLPPVDPSTIVAPPPPPPVTETAPPPAVTAPTEPAAPPPPPAPPPPTNRSLCVLGLICL